MAKPAKHISHYRRHSSISYPSRISLRLYSHVLIPGVVLVLAAIVVRSYAGQYNLSQIPWSHLFSALGISFGRLIIAYILSLALAIPLALAINANALTEKILLPTFDIIQSIPVLAFFPVLLVFFIRFHQLAAAAIFIIFINMLGNIVFSVVGGIREIPGDIKAASYIFHIRRGAYLRRVLIPAIFPYIVTGSLLAWAEGWNILIVAEVLHTYIPGGGSSLDLSGIGSTLVHASAAGQSGLFIAAIAVMVLAIGVMNLFVWQKLLRLAEKYRFE